MMMLMMLMMMKKERKERKKKKRKRSSEEKEKKRRRGEGEEEGFFKRCIFDALLFNPVCAKVPVHKCRSCVPPSNASVQVRIEYVPWMVYT